MPTPRDEAQRWLERRIDAARWVGPAEELPAKAAATILRREGLIVDALDGAAWVIRTPNDDSDDAVRQRVYWPLVSLLTERYAPAAVDRLAAVRLYLGEQTPPEKLIVRQGLNRSERTYRLAAGSTVSVVPVPDGVPHDVVGLPGSRTAPSSVLVTGVSIPATAPAWTVQSLTAGDLRGNLALVGAWLRGLTLGRKEIERVFLAIGRPVVFARVARLAKEVGNAELADRIEQTLHDLGAQRPSPSKVSLAPRVVPATVVAAPRTGAPWLDRFAELFTRGAASLSKSRIGQPPAAPLPLRAILTFARASKREDTYHSTTIEGYRVSREEVDAILGGADPGRNRSPEEVERLMALKGYGIAFDESLEILQSAGPRVVVTEALIHDLYAALWWPSVDAGLVAGAQLRAWRPRPAFIRGSRYVPPAPEKLQGLMPLFCQLVNELEGTPVVRAAMTHWGFETLHPYPDGNGRVGRLLMNLVLCAEGQPWVTILSDDRDAYFRALARAQVEESFLEWGRFLATRVTRARRKAEKVAAAGKGPSRR